MRNTIDEKLLKRIDVLLLLSSTIGGMEWNIRLYESNNEECLPFDVLDNYERELNHIPFMRELLEKLKLELMDMIKELVVENKELNERINQIDKENERSYQREILEERIQKLLNRLGDGDESDDKRIVEEIGEYEEELYKL